MKDEINSRHEVTECRAAPFSRRAFALLVIACCFAPLLTGCVVAGAIAHAIPETNHAAYTGLAGQTVGVMVWAESAVRMDWNSVQIDLANAVQNKLRSSPAEEMKGASFPWQPASIVRFQKEHPAIEADPITVTAPKILGVSRLIYIEVVAISTRADASVQMYRGSAVASLKVIEVVDGQGHIAYEESDIRATFPPKSPPEGVINSSDRVMYTGTLDAMANHIVDRLTTHMIE